MTFVERYGPWALIAGASEGTGAAFARALAARGFDLILVARREGPLARLQADLRREYGTEAVGVSIDLTSPEALPKILAVVGEREVGLVIANAGADLNGRDFLDADLAVWGDLIALNVVTPLKLCHHFARFMRGRRRGGIILIGTGVSYGGMGSLAVYAGSKSFLLSFGESLWSELRPFGVDVLNLMLGRTDTPAFRRALAEKRLPLPPGLADPDEVAAEGLDRLPHGPVHNFGISDDQCGFAPTSASERRARVARLDTAGQAVLKRE